MSNRLKRFFDFTIINESTKFSDLNKYFDYDLFVRDLKAAGADVNEKEARSFVVNLFSGGVIEALMRKMLEDGHVVSTAILVNGQPVSFDYFTSWHIWNKLIQYEGVAGQYFKNYVKVNKLPFLEASHKSWMNSMETSNILDLLLDHASFSDKTSAMEALGVFKKHVDVRKAKDVYVKEVDKRGPVLGFIAEYHVSNKRLPGTRFPFVIELAKLFGVSEFEQHWEMVFDNFAYGNGPKFGFFGIPKDKVRNLLKDMGVSGNVISDIYRKIKNS